MSVCELDCAFNLLEFRGKGIMKDGCLKRRKQSTQQTHTRVQVRKYMKTVIKPGIPLTEMCETLEGTVRKLIDERGLDAGEKRKTVKELRTITLLLDITACSSIKGDAFNACQESNCQ